jgi:hypothetical protein
VSGQLQWALLISFRSGLLFLLAGPMPRMPTPLSTGITFTDALEVYFQAFSFSSSFLSPSVPPPLPSFLLS